MPIIGHGDIAQAIIDRPDVTFFASGVSNSAETDTDVYQREINLLLDQRKHTHLVYFSSLCIYYGATPYADHKRYMEWLVKQHFPYCTIVRLGNISWGDNPHTLINYLRANPGARVEQVYRHIVSKDVFQYWMSLIPVGRISEMNVTGVRVWVPELMREIREGKW